MIALGFEKTVSAQDFKYKEYIFSTPGSACHFVYSCYSQTSDHTNLKRPFVFVLGKPGQTSLEAYKSDKLNSLPEFSNYLFVYMPNKGGSAGNKLLCVNGLVSLLSWNISYGNKNIFLSVYDTTLTEADIIAAGVKNTFGSIQFIKPEVLNLTNATEGFKETAYENDDADGNENLGTFYYEEEKKEDEKDGAVPYLSKKTYFGPPQSTNYTLSGIIKDKSTGEGLPFASVQVTGSLVRSSSNVDGYFTLSKVPSDTCVLVVSYIGYNKSEVYLTPALPKSNFIIELTPSSNLLKTITVTSVREDAMLQKKEDVSVIKLTPRQIEKLPNVGEKDVMRSFQLMPGVSASQESSSGLYVRGGTPDQNLVLYDGFTVYHVDHLYGYFSAFNSNVVKDIQLYKGGFESRFGGRLSSVTEITGKDGNQKKFNMGGDISLLSINAWAEIPVGEKFSSIIAYRRSYKGPIYNALFDKYSKSSSTQTTQQAGPGGGRFMQDTEATSYFHDLNGKFTYRPSLKDIVTLSIFNGNDKLDNSIDNSSTSLPGGGAIGGFNFSSTDLTKYGNVGSSLKWSRKWTDKFYGNTLISYSNFYSDRDRSMERTSTDASGNESTTKSGVFENNNLKDYSFKSDYQWDLFDFSQLQFGVFGTSFDIKYTYAQSDTATLLDKRNKALLSGAYLQSKFRFFKNKFVILPGIRINNFETTQQQYYEPRVSATYNLSDRLSVKGSAGKFYQFANRVTREDILSGSKEFWLLADGNSVTVSSSIHNIVGLSYETTDYLLSVEGYYKRISNLTEYSLRFNPSPTGTTFNENFFTGNGYAKGVEFLLQKKTGKFNGWVSYTLGEAKNHFDIYSDGYYSANQDVTHEFKSVFLYNWKRWDFSATWVFATGRPYTAPSGAYSVTLLDGNTQDYFTVTTKNGLRLPDYHRADISANYKLLKGSKGDKKRREFGYIGFSIFNLYNRTNVWYKTYSIEEGSVIETNVNYSGLTPNITLSLKLR